VVTFKKAQKRLTGGDMNSNVGMAFNSLLIHLAFISKDLVCLKTF